MVKNVTVNVNEVYAYDIGADPGDPIAEDVQFTLPEVALKTTTVYAMGEFNVPVIGQIEDLEGSVHHQGVDSELVKLLKQKSICLDLRWVQQIFDDDGKSDLKSCKANLTVFPKVVAPEIGVEMGSLPDIEVKFGITKYQLTCDGKVLWNIDRLKKILEIDGENYYKDIKSVLHA